MIVDLNVGPREYFKERIETAASQLQIELGDQTEFYLVNLLCDFIEFKEEDDSKSILDKPLAFLLKEAEEESPSQSIRTFKKLGDVSLYIGGYFQQFFKNKSYDVNYYIMMGSTAYERVARLMRDIHSDKSFSTLYGGLSEQFYELVDVVSEVSESHVVSPHLSLVKKYDQYLKTGSSELEKKLEENGLLPKTKINIA